MTLYLTPQEHDVFTALPPALQDGWTVVHEPSLSFETDDELMLRLKISRIKDPACVMLLKQLLETSTSEEMHHILEGFDISTISRDAFIELLFTLGVRGMMPMVLSALRHATVDTDLEGVASLSLLRHELSVSNTHAS